jgi:hypothetical protein
VRHLATTLLLASALLLAPGLAGAGPTKSIDYSLKGSATWNAITYPTSFAISGDVLDGSRVVGSYSGTIETSAYAPCAEPNNPYGPICASVTGGTIALALHGGTVTAAVDGGTVWQALASASHDEYVIELTSSVTGGTHAYRSAGGTLSLLYSTVRNNFAPDPATGNPCISVDVLTCPIIDVGALTGTITR